MAYYPFNAALGSRGKLLTTADPDENANPGTGSTATHFYNGEGEQIKTNTPLPGGNTLTQETETSVINSITIKGTVIAPAVRSISKTNGITTSTSYRSVGGGEQISASVTLSGKSLTIQTRPTDGAWTSTSISPDGQKNVETHTQGRPDKSELFDNQNNLLHTTTQTYGDLNRLVSVTDSRTGAVTYNGYLESGSVTSTTSNNGTEVTAYLYDKMGRVITTTLPDNSTTHTSYTLRGQVKASWGSQTNPTVNLYNADGQLIKLRTFRSSDLTLAPDESTANYDETTWIYNSRGQLARKEYADGKGTNYTYTAAGRLKTRVWARGVTTTYSYQNGLQTNIDYSDATPDVNYVYDNFGRQTSISNGISKSEFAYHPTTLHLAEETISYNLDGQAGFEFTRTLDRSRDTLGRDSGFQLRNGNTPENHAIYSYDTASRLSSVTAPSGTFTYNYLANSGNLIESVVR